MKTQFQVLLYYKYVALKNPVRIQREQKRLCEKLGLKGRIIVATEGINGTLEGTSTNTEKYINEMNKNIFFKDIVYKKSVGIGTAFPKLSVKTRPEIVTTGIPNLNPTQVTGKRLTAEQLKSWFELKKEFYIVDMRNEYEYKSGYFENSIFSGISNFFDLPKVLPKIEHLKNKTVVTVCTGGVRCEKASAFLLVSGFTDVYQLQDGIQTYMEKYPNENFKGKLYVFDGRLTIGFNTDSPSYEMVGRCRDCNVPCESYVNCEYDECHFHYISCHNCKDLDTQLYFCKPECKKIYLSKLSKKNLKKQQTI